MSILSWFLKPKREMAKEHTKHVRMGKYEVSSHAQNRTADNKRKLTKRDMIQNLFGNSLESKPYTHHDGKTVQYDRLNKKNRTVTHIITGRNLVKTIRKYHKENERKELNKFGGNKNKQ